MRSVGAFILVVAATEVKFGNGSWTFTGKSTLVDAVTSWITNESTATANYGKISTWDVSKIDDMYDLFGTEGAFNSDIGDWDTSSVTDMGLMFKGATSFNQPLDTWNTSKALNTIRMVESATSFNQPLGTWDVSSVKN